MILTTEITSLYWTHWLVLFIMAKDCVLCEVRNEYLQQRSISVADFSTLRIGFDLRSAHVTLGWTKWHWAGISPQHFGFPMSVSFYKRNILVYLHVAPVEGQMDEAWERSTKQCLRYTVAGLSQRRPGFHSGPVYVRFLLSPEQGFPLLLRFSPVSITAQIFHTHLHRSTSLLKRTDHRKGRIFK